jgi:hypothetical protein
MLHQRDYCCIAAKLGRIGLAPFGALLETVVRREVPLEFHGIEEKTPHADNASPLGTKEQNVSRTEDDAAIVPSFASAGAKMVAANVGTKLGTLDHPDAIRVIGNCAGPSR